MATEPLPAGAEQLLSLLPEAHLITDAQGRVRGANAAARQLLPGATVDADLADSLADAAQLPPLLGRWGRSTSLRPGTLELTGGTHLRADGARLPGWPLLLVRLREKDRALAPFQGINQQVETANLRELSRRLEATVHELRSANLRLAAANDEVQQYARAVAHDVRTPLFTMQGFAQLLADDGNLDEAGTEYVGFILEATERLQQTTDGLLAVARLDRAAPRGDERTDATDALRDVLADLGSELRAGEITVDVGELPVVAVERAALRRVLQNLLVNSVRHGRREDRPLRIEVTGRRLGATAAISVRDDGVGVEAADRERLFDLFHRGVGSSSVPGTGIGLAACRKIVTAWGGTITCEPVQGPGASFVFTAPAAVDASATA